MPTSINIWNADGIYNTLIHQNIIICRSNICRMRQFPLSTFYLWELWPRECFDDDAEADVKRWWAGNRQQAIRIKNLNIDFLCHICLTHLPFLYILFHFFSLNTFDSWKGKKRNHSNKQTAASEAEKKVAGHQHYQFNKNINDWEGGKEREWEKKINVIKWNKKK